MDISGTRDNTRDLITGRRNLNRFGHSSHESKMTFKTCLPIAKQLKEESGTRYSVRYLIKVYQTPQALERKLTWVRGCKASVG
jgi:hypothetical protein